MEEILLYIGSSFFIILITLYIAKSVFDIPKMIKNQSDQIKLLALIAEKIGVDQSRIDKIIPKLSDQKVKESSKDIDDL